jgi:hypothetical protein
VQGFSLAGDLHCHGASVSRVHGTQTSQMEVEPNILLIIEKCTY